MVSNLSFEFDKNILIRGQNGVGKSTLLKTLLGIHTCFSGDIIIPKFPDCMFIPQDIFLPSKISLRNIFGYGCCHNYQDFHEQCKGTFLVSNEEISRTLEELDLLNIMTLLDSFDTEIETKSLSSGERQRLIFGRILISKPKVVFIDEGFSNIDKKGKTAILNLIIRNKTLCVLVDHSSLIDVGNWKCLEFTAGGVIKIDDL